MSASLLNPTDKFVEIKNLKKYYPLSGGGVNRVLDGINLRINYGDKVGILGRNGAGKSTLIKIIGGVLRPTSGKVVRKMKVSWPLAFSGGFQGSLTGLDNLKFICRIYGVDWRDKVEKVQEIADLGRYLYEPVKTYSAGMRARLAFALSTVIEFECYLIDEVVAVGDARFRERCLTEMFEKRKDRTYIMVSHQPSFIKKYCNRFFVLTNGKLIEFEEFEEAWRFYSVQ